MSTHLAGSTPMTRFLELTRETLADPGRYPELLQLGLDIVGARQRIAAGPVPRPNRSGDGVVVFAEFDRDKTPRTLDAS